MVNPYDCEHTEIELRKRVYANGTVHYQEQCLRCGAALRAFKHTSNEVAQARLTNGIPDFDETLRDAFYEKARQVYTAQREAGSAEWWIWYEAYLQSDEWSKIRTEVLRRDQHICQGCRERRATHVHHLTYDHVGGNEFLFELISLCEVCHKRLHGDGHEQPTNDRVRAAIPR